MKNRTFQKSRVHKETDSFLLFEKIRDTSSWFKVEYIKGCIYLDSFGIDCYPVDIKTLEAYIAKLQQFVEKAKGANK